MAVQSEVGLFVDFENIRFSLLNLFGQEPDPQLLMEIARRYGPVAVAYAYADFNEHPPIFRRKLEVAGISTRDVPRRSPDVAHKSSADMAMLMDIIDCLLDRPHVETLVLMTGDSDFIRAVARARHRFGKRVVISGVPGSVSSDLVESADLEDPILDPRTPRTRSALHLGDETSLLQLILWLSQHRPYMTFGFIRSHALSPHHGLNMSEERVTDILSGFKEQGVLIEGARTANDGRTLRTLDLNRDHAFVAETAALGGDRFESAQDTEGAGDAGDDELDDDDRVDPPAAVDTESADRPTDQLAADVGEQDGWRPAVPNADAAPNPDAVPNPDDVAAASERSFNV